MKAKVNISSKDVSEKININSISQESNFAPSNVVKDKLTLYSDYGYIETNKEDYENSELLVIPFIKKKTNVVGSISVSLY
jgi:phage baseplate assembly protein gpV